MSELDSFFAKKNKKKVKGKKFANPDDIAKRLEEKEKKLEKDLHKIEPKKLLDDVLVSVKNSPAVQVTKKEEEEEWQDYKDACEHDLTDLKLSKLQIENDEDYGGYGSGEEGVQNNKGDTSDGVWGKAAPIEKRPPTPPPAVVETKTPANSQPSSYLPPHMRNQGSALPRASNRKSKQAPDITNEMAFPSLGDVPASAPTTPWSGGNRPRTDDVRYESSKYGATRTVEQQAPRINTSNRFNALSDRS